MHGPAEASVVAASFCICLEMPRKAFLEALDKHPEAEIRALVTASPASEETDHFEQPRAKLHANWGQLSQG